MNICFLAGTLGRGGAERQLCFMLRALQGEGLNPKLLCLTRGESLEKEIRDLGVEVTWVGSSGNRLLRMGEIYKTAHAMKLSLIQSSHFYTNTYAGAVSKLMGIPSIGAIRSDLKSELRANPVFGKLHLRLPDRLIANSRVGRDNAIASGVPPHRLDLVPNVVEKRGSLNGSKASGGRFTFLFSGRLVWQKRPELFIQLAARLSASMPDRELRFLVLGDGVLRRELEARAAALNLLPARISFLGERSDVDTVYSEADALVLTSKIEGTPNVVLEAMSHGIPVVATSVGGIKDLVTKSRGILVDPLDFDGLTQAARKLVVDREFGRALGADGRRYVEQSHSVEKLGKSLIQIYNKAVGRSS